MLFILPEARISTPRSEVDMLILYFVAFHDFRWQFKNTEVAQSFSLYLNLYIRREKEKSDSCFGCERQVARKRTTAQSESREIASVFCYFHCDMEPLTINLAFQMRISVSSAAGAKI